MVGIRVSAPKTCLPVRGTSFRMEWEAKARCAPANLREYRSARDLHRWNEGLGVLLLLAHALEKRIAKHTVRFRRSVEIVDTCIEALRLNQAC